MTNATGKMVLFSGKIAESFVDFSGFACIIKISFTLLYKETYFLKEEKIL